MQNNKHFLKSQYVNTSVSQLVMTFDKMNFDKKLPFHLGLLTKKTKEERVYTQKSMSLYMS